VAANNGTTALITGRGCQR